MILNSGEFETMTHETGEFVIYISQESDYSSDGGFTFADVTNSFYINRDDAKDLIAELQRYVDGE